MDSNEKPQVGSHKRCSYGLCKSDARTREYYEYCNFYFISFPKPCLLLRQSKIPSSHMKYHVRSCAQCKKSARWVRLCGRTDSKFNSIYRVNKHSYICSLHFVGESGPTEQYPEPIPFIKSNIIENKRLQKERKSLQEKYNANNDDKPESTKEEETVPASEIANFEMVTINEDQIKTEIDENENKDGIMPFSVGIDEISSNLEINAENLQAIGENLQNPLLSDDLITIKYEPFPEEPQNPDATLQDTIFENNVEMIPCEALLEKVTHDRGVQTLKSFYNPKKEEQSTLIEIFEQSLSKEKEKCVFYTRLQFPQIKTLLSVLTPNCNYLIYWNYENRSKDAEKHKLTKIQELIITLVYLRRASPFQDLSYRFEIPENLIKATIITWIKFMYSELKQFKSGMFVSRANVIDKMPQIFKEFKNLRVLIMCTEFYSLSLPSVNIDIEDHQYSKKDTFEMKKALIGFTPTGRISFVSPVHEGSTSNRKMFIETDVSDLIDPDDLILVDKDIFIHDLIAKEKAKSHVPEFLRSERILQSNNDLKTKIINQQKNLVQQTILQIKQFRILQEKLPNSMEKYATEILFICACVKNLNHKFIDKV